MPEKIPFIHKLISRLEKIDRKSLKSYVEGLCERNLLFEEILAQIHEAVLVLSRNDRIDWMNAGAEDLLGVRASPDEPLEISQIIKDRELLAWIQANRDLREKKVKDIRAITPREIFMRTFLIPIGTPPEKKRLLILSDLRGQSFKTLAEGHLARIAAVISLAAGVAHEIGNPLNAIGIHLELMKKDLKSIQDPRRKLIENTLEVIASETRRLDKIVRNFLKATRKPPLRFQTADLNAVAEDALNFLKPELETHGIQVKFKTDETLPPFLLDSERIYQVFINLIKNAREAMEPGGILSLTISRREKVAMIRVKDTGKGISQEDVPHIFEAYYTTKEEGSGLGLMTVFDTVREHGGQIDVSSRVGRGTAFTLMLPIRHPKLQLPQYKMGKNI